MVIQKPQSSKREKLKEMCRGTRGKTNTCMERKYLEVKGRGEQGCHTSEILCLIFLFTT